MVLLALHLYPGGVIAWIVVGLIAGAIAGRLASGHGYGCLGDIILGLIGAFVGGIVVSLFVKGNTTAGFLGTIVVAIVGAVILVLALRVIRRTL